MTSSTNNTWGLGFSETFDVFGSTANNDPSWYMAIPNRYLRRRAGAPDAKGQRCELRARAIRASPRSTTVHPTDALHPAGRRLGRLHRAARVITLYTRAGVPKEYWNRIAFINEPTAHLIGQGILEKQGAGFVTRDGWNLSAGAEEWFAPVARAGRTGRRGVVRRLVQLHRAAQPDAARLQQRHGQRVRDVDARSSARPHLSHRLQGRRAVTKKRSLSKTDTAGLLERARVRQHVLAPDGAAAARRTRTERRRAAAASRSSRNTASMRSASTAARCMRSGRSRDWASSTRPPAAMRIARRSTRLKHPAAGVRKAAAMVLPTNAAAASAMLAAGLLQDPDLHTRLAATLVLAEMPDVGRDRPGALRESQKPDNYTDKWLSRAFYIAAMRHQKTFTAAYNADKQCDAVRLRCRWRCGSARSSRTGVCQMRQDVAADWKDMQVPGNWESRGLPDFDGVVWFTRTFDWAAAATDRRCRSARSETPARSG